MPRFLIALGANWDSSQSSSHQAFKTKDTSWWVPDKREESTNQLSQTRHLFFIRLSASQSTRIETYLVSRVSIYIHKSGKMGLNMFESGWKNKKVRIGLRWGTKYMECFWMIRLQLKSTVAITKHWPKSNTARSYCHQPINTQLEDSLTLVKACQPSSQTDIPVNGYSQIY